MQKGPPIRMNQVSPEILATPPAENEPDATPSIITHVNTKKNRNNSPRSSVGGDSTISRHSTRSAHIIYVEQKEKLELIKISQERKNYISIVRPAHNRNISGWTSKGYYGSIIKGCVPGTESLIKLEEFFISRAGNKYDAVYDPEFDLGPAKYQVFNSTGEVQFFATETLQDFESYPSRVRAVDITVTGVKGGIVFYISGTNKVAQVKNDASANVLGTISRFGVRSWIRPSYKYWSYVVYSSDGEQVCRFQRTTEGYYDLHFPGHKSLDGKATENIAKSKYILPNTPDPTNIFGIDLSAIEKSVTKLSSQQKTLLLASSILIFDTYSKEENFGPNKTRFKHGLIYNLFIGAIMLILIIVLIVTTNSGNPTPKLPVCPKRIP